MIKTGFWSAFLLIIPERFITDKYAGVKKEDRRKDGQEEVEARREGQDKEDKQTVSLHIVKSPASVHGAR